MLRISKRLTRQRPKLAYSAVHLSRDKCVGPTTCVIFLGIELDSVRRTARLPTDKQTELIYLLEKLPVKRSCRLKDLQTPVTSRKLSHPCAVVPQGRTFLRRLLDLLIKGLFQQAIPVYTSQQKSVNSIS